MGKKKRGYPDVEEILCRPWCYYCERDFEDLKLLISHQKAKHFKCDRCGKRLNTAGGLSVHMNQVHKETLEHVENALPNRQSLDIEIFGMEGVPDDIIQQHNQRIIQNFYTAQAERHAATGNPPPGERSSHGPAKKIKIESADELKARLAEHRKRVAAAKAAAANGTALPATGPLPGSIDGKSPGQGASPFPPPQLVTGPPPGGAFPYPPPGVVPAAVPSYSPAQAFPPSYPPGPSPPPGPPGAGFNLPARPPTGGAPPQRPPYFYNGAGAPPPGYPGGPSTVDELVSGASRPHGDDIDQLIRMAEAGIKPAAPKAGAEEAATEKKGKKDKEKNTRMVYGDSEVSPEEKMVLLPRYQYVAAV